MFISVLYIVLIRVATILIFLAMSFESMLILLENMPKKVKNIGKKLNFLPNKIKNVGI